VAGENADACNALTGARSEESPPGSSRARVARATCVLREAGSTALPPVQVRAEGAGAGARPGAQTTATLAAKFRKSETR
jgi:hypothetical protein